MAWIIYSPMLVNGGASFQLAHSPNGGSDKNILTPAPFNLSTGLPGGFRGMDQSYGFLHPTNLVSEGNYVYAFVEHRPASNPSGLFPNKLPALGQASWIDGPILIRCPILRLGMMGNPANGGGHYWEMFSADAQWHSIARFSWQDRTQPNTTQQPYVFLQSLANKTPASATNNINNWMGPADSIQNVRRVGNYWVTLGNVFNFGVVFSYTASLASPLSLDSNVHMVTTNDVSLVPANFLSYFQRNGRYRYLSFFDTNTPSSPDPLVNANFQTVRQNTWDPRLVVSNGAGDNLVGLTPGLLPPVAEPRQSQYRYWNIHFSGF